MRYSSHVFFKIKDKGYDSYCIKQTEAKPLLQLRVMAKDRKGTERERERPKYRFI